MKIIVSDSHSPVYNLAFEEFLFSGFTDDFLLFYVNENSVILGSNQSVRNEVNFEYCAANNIQIIRRKSGGGAVFHDMGNLNFSFIRTKNSENGLVYQSLSGDFLQPVIAWLSQLDVEVSRGERKDLWLPEGYKITGTASQIRKSRELHHGTLLIDADGEMLKQALQVQSMDLTVKATPSVRSKTKNILDYLREKKRLQITAAEFINVIIANAEKYYNTEKVTNADFDQSEIENRMGDYQDNEWNFRK